MTSTDTSVLNFRTRLDKLAMLLDRLPSSLPNNLYNLDPNFTVSTKACDLYEDDGFSALNAYLEPKLGSRKDGILQLQGRGPGLNAVDVLLRCFLEANPSHVLLHKWVNDLILAAQWAGSVSHLT
jgi:hypothetical protein